MTRAACAALVLLAATTAHAGPRACLALAPVAPAGNRPVALLPAPEGGGVFRIRYIHSVTRTPVVETYRVSGDAVVQTGIMFSEHGPGLPTAPDAGQTWGEVDGQFVVTLDRRFAAIRMRVHRDQSPQLLLGERAVDLAQWGNRALDLRVAPCAHPAS